MFFSSSQVIAMKFSQRSFTCAPRITISTSPTLNGEKYNNVIVSSCDCHVTRYITVLVEMTKFEGTRHGKMVAAQMLDVTIRVKDVRPFAVKQMVSN